MIPCRLRRKHQRVYVCDEHSFAVPHAVFAEQTQGLVVGARGNRTVQVVGLRCVVDKRLMQQAVEAEQPVRLAGVRGGDGGAV